MPGPINTGNIAKALWPGVNKWFGMGYNELPAEWPELFETETSNKAYEEDVLMPGFGLAKIKEQGKSIAYDSTQQSWVKRYVHVTWALGFMLTEEVLEDNQYPKLAMQWSKALGFAMRQTKDINGANVFNRGWTAGYVGGDNVTFFSASHPSQAGTWSNSLTPAADLSEQALEDITIMIYGFKDDRGNQIGAIPRKLVVHPNDWFEAHRILKSVKQSGTANNDTNVLREMNVFTDGIKMNHYLTDPDAFFVKTSVSNGTKHMQRRALAPPTRENDFDTSNIKYKVTERYVFGVTDPRSWTGSQGA